jgi:hypothetical protein
MQALTQAMQANPDSIQAHIARINRHIAETAKHIQETEIGLNARRMILDEVRAERLRRNEETTPVSQTSVAS